MASDARLRKRAMSRLRAHILRGMRQAMLHVEGETKKALSRPQPTKRTKSGGRRGLDPSQEGEYPKVVTGALRASIKGRARREASAIVGTLSSDRIYARRLEFGFRGTDKRGRSYNQGPRPFIRPTIDANRAKILRLIADGGV